MTTEGNALLPYPEATWNESKNREAGHGKIIKIFDLSILRSVLWMARISRCPERLPGSWRYRGLARRRTVVVFFSKGVPDAIVPLVSPCPGFYAG
jgi:hypothetical protein